MAVEGVAGDDGVGENGGGLFEELLADGQFAVVVFYAVGAHGAAGSAGGFGDAFAVFFGEAAGGAEELLGVFLQGADPELFGALEVLIEVGAVALEAFGEAERGPVGGFVEGALVDGGVVETFG